MITALCKVLRPICMFSTLAMMALLIAQFMGLALIPGEMLWRLFGSYVVLLCGSFVLFWIDNPSNVFTGRNG
ncbi:MULTISPECIES: hypothetical protein [Mesorhizobium]|uniref:hypothetical protein n=1 Tax=Mesorhizobium TaxID=68287 RepID=UPI0010BF6A80|nr:MULTISPECIES: hypothetical protein [Mesorhizobium]